MLPIYHPLPGGQRDARDGAQPSGGREDIARRQGVHVPGMAIRYGHTLGMAMR